MPPYLSTLILGTVLGCSSQGDLAGDWVAAFYRESGTSTVVSAGDTGAADTGGGDTAAGDTGGGDTATSDTAGEVLPACEGDQGFENFRSWLRIDTTNPVQGVHYSLYPDAADAPRPAASDGVVPSSAMSGLVTGAWEGGVVQLDLVPDLDQPLATEADRAAWRDHHLHLESQVWGDRCWTARWSWVGTDGTPDPDEHGVVFVHRQ